MNQKWKLIPREGGLLHIISFLLSNYLNFLFKSCNQGQILLRIPLYFIRDTLYPFISTRSINIVPQYSASELVRVKLIIRLRPRPIVLLISQAPSI